MSGVILLTETMFEGTTGYYTFDLVDEADQGLDAAFLDSLTLTLSDVDSQQVINTRLNQDVLNVNNGTVTTDPGPPLVTTMTFEIQPADTVILNPNRWAEYRLLHFRWSWDSGRRVGAHVVQFGVENLSHVS